MQFLDEVLGVQCRLGGRSCCPGGASCCGLEEREGEVETTQGDDTADWMTDSFHAHKDATTHDILSHKHAFHFRACEKTVVFVMHAAGVYSVYTPPSNCRYHVPAIRNCMLKMFWSLTALRQAFEECHHQEFQFCHEEFCHDETTKTKYAADLPAALRTISILSSDQQRTHNLYFLRIADSDFDAFVCSDELVCRAALFPPYTRLVVADILFLLRHNLSVVVEVVEALQHLSREPNALNFVFVQLS